MGGQGDRWKQRLPIKTVALSIEKLHYKFAKLAIFSMRESLAQKPLTFGFLEDDPSDENLDDLYVGEKSLANAVLYNTDWTTETLIHQVRKGSIDLTPSFQRRDAWSLIRKSQFIESILLNFPVPPLTLAEKSNSKTFLVVDGKQRLTTLAQFFGLLEGSQRNNFALRGLKELVPLNGKTAREIELEFPDLYMRLENYSIRTNVIRGWKNDEVLYSIFLRLNSGSVKLSAQELRQALHPGPFATWILDYSEGSDALRSIFPGPEPDFRMRDLELIVRYFGFQVHLESYRGDLKRFLDTTVSRLNEDWPIVHRQVEHIATQFEKMHDAAVQVFGPDHVYRKWNGDAWENRLNRAVFDLITFYHRTDAQIASFIDHGDEIVDAFKTICEESYEFRDAIETTTKSIEAVSTRLGIWGSILERIGIIDNQVRLSQERVLRYDDQFNIF